MAKKEKVNKTQTVLAYLKAHSGTSNKDASEALAKQGIEVTPGHVANIKGKAKADRARKAVGTRLLAGISEKSAATEPAVAERPAKPGDAITLEHVKVVAQTVKTIGGFDRLNDLLGVIKEVGGMKRFKDLLEAMAASEPDQIPF